MPTIYTIGHSNAGPERVLDALERHDVRLLVDVRTAPTSRRAPWASIHELPRLLASRGIAYEHWKVLGGLRKPAPGSGNDAWEDEGFRGYADHMQTAEFASAVERLLAEPRVLAVMCAEAAPAKCHRSLLADALVARGARVVHLVPPEAAEHALTASASVEGTRVTYPARARQARLGAGDG